jgi:hypothetical protein
MIRTGARRRVRTFRGGGYLPDVADEVARRRTFFKARGSRPWMSGLLPIPVRDPASKVARLALVLVAAPPRRWWRRITSGRRPCVLLARNRIGRATRPPFPVKLASAGEAVRPLDQCLAHPGTPLLQWSGGGCTAIKGEKLIPDVFRAGDVIQPPTMLRAVLHDADAPKRQIRRAADACAAFLSLSCSPGRCAAVEGEGKDSRLQTKHPPGCCDAPQPRLLGRIAPS